VATMDNVSIEPLPRPAYVTSWLGNSFGSQYYQGHVQMQIGAMCIQPGERPLLRMTGQNEALDSSAYDLDGNLLYMYQLQHAGGQAIACDGTRMFETTGGGKAGKNRLDRFAVSLDRAWGDDRANLKSTLAGTAITGLGVRDGKVYVADATRERIVVLDAATLAEVRAFPSPRPGALALGRDGGLWVVRRPGVKNDGPIFEVRPVEGPADDTPPAQVLCYGLDGKVMRERTIAFAGIKDAVIPDKIAVNPRNGHLYVCDVGRSQCVWIFDPNGRPAGQLGQLHGVYGAKVPGTADAK